MNTAQRLRKLLEIVNLKEAISKAKKLAEEKLAKGEDADEFVEIAETDGFKIYITAGKTIKFSPIFFTKIQGTFSCWCLREK